MKKHLLFATSVLLFTGSTFAQFSASTIWSLNKSVDPMPHNSINFSYFDMGVTYSPTGVPITGSSSNQPGLPLPKFRITSTTTANTVVCISSEQEDNDPWEDKERATFMHNGTIDTSITIEESSNGSAFEFRSKIVYQAGKNVNEYAYERYTWLSGQWNLRNKNFYYLANGRIDSVVQYNFTSTVDSTRVGYQLFYYSSGLDSTLTWELNTITGAFELDDKVSIEQKENGKTKRFALYDFNSGSWSKSATFTYSNGLPSGLSESNSREIFSIFPNPATTYLQLEAQSGESFRYAIITNLTGQKVKEVTNETRIDITDLEKGLYTIQLFTSKGSSFQKFIKY